MQRREAGSWIIMSTRETMPGPSPPQGCYLAPCNSRSAGHPPRLSSPPSGGLKIPHPTPPEVTHLAFASPFLPPSSRSSWTIGSKIASCLSTTARVLPAARRMGPSPPSWSAKPGRRPAITCRAPRPINPAEVTHERNRPCDSQGGGVWCLLACCGHSAELCMSNSEGKVERGVHNPRERKAAPWEEATAGRPPPSTPRHGPGAAVLTFPSRVASARRQGPHQPLATAPATTSEAPSSGSDSRPANCLLRREGGSSGVSTRPEAKGAVLLGGPAGRPGTGGSW